MATLYRIVRKRTSIELSFRRAAKRGLSRERAIMAWPNHDAMASRRIEE
jgi:hypothetical protein